MKRSLYIPLLALAFLPLACSTHNAAGISPLDKQTESQFAELQKYYSRVLGEPVTFTVVHIHVNEPRTPELDYIDILFDVSPAKLKVEGNKVSTVWKDAGGKEHWVQTCMLRRQGATYVGWVGHQIDVPKEHHRKIELRKE